MEEKAAHCWHSLRSFLGVGGNPGIDDPCILGDAALRHFPGRGSFRSTSPARCCRKERANPAARANALRAWLILNDRWKKDDRSISRASLSLHGGDRARGLVFTHFIRRAKAFIAHLGVDHDRFSARGSGLPFLGSDRWLRFPLCAHGMASDGDHHIGTEPVLDLRKKEADPAASANRFDKLTAGARERDVIRMGRVRSAFPLVQKGSLSVRPEPVERARPRAAHR